MYNKLFQYLRGQKKSKLKSGFTIVELIVVIVIIGILAAISFVSYGGLTNRAVVVSLQSDLTNSSDQLKIYKAYNKSFPTSLDEDNCPLTPISDTNYCLKASANNSYTKYESDGVTFGLQETNVNGIIYNITDSTIVAAGELPVLYKLTIIAGAGGTVNTIINGRYASDSTKTITAIPNASYVFSSWSGSTGCSGVASHTITMDENKSCTANFIFPSPYIQTITATGCPSTRTQVQDARDNHTYWIQRLADGKCWMSTNLAYAGGGTNTYGDVRTLTQGATYDPETYTVANYYVTPSTTNFTIEPTAPSTSTNGTGQYGYLYNFCAATGGDLASAGCSSTITTPLPVVSASICPSGWRLPIGNGSELTALNTVLNGGSTKTDAGLIRDPWLAQLGGYWSSGFGNTQGSYGYYWSSTQIYTNLAYSLDFFSTYVSSNGATSKGKGFAVRCVAN